MDEFGIEFDTGFFDHTEKNEYSEEPHPQDVVEDEINREIEMEEEY